MGPTTLHRTAAAATLKAPTFVLLSSGSTTLKTSTPVEVLLFVAASLRPVLPTHCGAPGAYLPKASGQLKIIIVVQFLEVWEYLATPYPT